MIKPENFWKKVQVGDPDECWPWQAGFFDSGYGRIKVDGKGMRTHRVAFFLTYGEWPEICRHAVCGNKSCCNPLHLADGTPKDNAQDQLRLGENYHANKTHCDRGHLFDEENTLVYKGGRYCRACRRYRESQQPQRRERRNAARRKVGA